MCTQIRIVVTMDEPIIGTIDNGRILSYYSNVCHRVSSCRRERF